MHTSTRELTVEPRGTHAADAGVDCVPTDGLHRPHSEVRTTMRFSYLCFGVAAICLIATAAYRDAWVAAGIFAGVGLILFFFERRQAGKQTGPGA
jgi:hypothetical protein